MKPLLLFAVLIFFPGAATEAQNVKFSQYDQVPLLLNPATTGQFEGLLRVGVLASRQKAGAAVLNHGTLYGDYRIENGMGPMGIGLSYYQNGQTDFQLSSRFLGLSVAQHLALDYDGFHQISLGAQVGMAGSRLDSTRKYFHSSLSAGGTNTPVPGAREGFTDVNLGLMYTYQGDEVRVESGLSAYQVLNPNAGEGFSLGRRVAFHADAGFSLGLHTVMHLKALLWKERLHWKGREVSGMPRAESVWGVLMESGGEGTASVVYGLSTRNLETVMVTGGLELAERLRLAVSYEHPMNKEVYGVSRGELGVVYCLDQSR